MTEIELIERYTEARRKYESIKTSLSEAERIKDDAERALYEHMNNEGKTRSATYAGLGFVGIGDPYIYASCKEENKEALHEWLNSIEMGSLVKPTVHSKTLSSLVKQRLADNESLPEFITYYLKPNVKLYERE